MTLKERITYFVLVSLRALSGILDIVGIGLIGLLAGLAASNLDPGKPLVVFGFTLPETSPNTLMILVLVVLVVFAVKAVIAVALGRVISVFLAKIESKKATEIAEYLFASGLSRLLEYSKAEIVWALMGSVSFAFSGLLTSLSTLVTEGILLILVAGTFVFVDPFAALFVFLYFGLIIVGLQILIGKALKKTGQDSAEGAIRSVGVIEDTISAFREISILNKQEFFVKEFSEARKLTANSAAISNFLGGMPRYVVETALMLGVVIFVGYQFVTGQLATGLVTVGVFLTGGVRIMASLLPLQNATANMKSQVEQALLAKEVLGKAESQSNDQLEAVPNVTASVAIVHEPVSKPEFGLEVVLENVSFTYPEATSSALSDISLHIKAGQHVAFIGPSGAGKTTIVDIVLGLLAPTEGRVIVAGHNTDSASLVEQGLVAYVPQNPGIVSGTIAENVALGNALADIDEERVAAALAAANLSDFVSSLPNGIMTSVGSQADALSGGQIQRLGLARALYGQPKLIVLDEATSALDASSEAYISSSLKNLGKDVTVIVIAHRLSTVQHSDSVYVVEDGKITASGSFMHLRKTVPMVAEYVKLMSFEQAAD